MGTKRPRPTDSPWPWKEHSDLMAHVQRAYQDLRDPRMHFISTAARQQPYRDLVVELESMAPVVDDTDINCDACFSYAVDADDLLFVRLSMVGPYAMFERHLKDGRTALITSKENCSSDLERNILRALVRRGLRPLSHPQLTAAIDLNLPDVETATVYNALFTREGEPPAPAEPTGLG